VTSSKVAVIALSFLRARQCSTAWIYRMPPVRSTCARSSWSSRSHHMSPQMTIALRPASSSRSEKHAWKQWPRLYQTCGAHARSGQHERACAPQHTSVVTSAATYERCCAHSRLHTRRSALQLQASKRR